MLQRVNVNAHSIVRIDFKTQNGRNFAKKNRWWSFKSWFWKVRVVLHDATCKLDQKMLCALYITSKIAKNPIFRVHNLKYLKILTWWNNSELGFGFYAKKHFGNNFTLSNNKTLQTCVIGEIKKWFIENLNLHLTWVKLMSKHRENFQFVSFFDSIWNKLKT